MHIGGLLGDGQRHGQRLVKNEEAEAECRGHDLGEAAGIQDAALGVHRLDGRDILAGEAQLAVGIVLEDGDVVLAGKLIDLFALFERGRDAGGVLEGRNGIEQLCVRVRLQRGLERVDVHAVLLHRHADELRAVGTEGIQTADKCRVLGQDDVALVDEHLGREVGALLTAGDDEQLVFLEIKALRACKVFLHGIAQRRIALRQAVLKHGDRRVLHDVGHDLRDLGNRKGLRGRIAAAERDHVGVCAELEQLADCRAMHVGHTMGNGVLHIYRS